MGPRKERSLSRPPLDIGRLFVIAFVVYMCCVAALILYGEHKAAIARHANTELGD